MADEQPREIASTDADTGKNAAVWEFNRDHVWPAAIVLALILVALVNFTFIYIAVSGADEIAPSYVSGPR